MKLNKFSTESEFLAANLAAVKSVYSHDKPVHIAISGGNTPRSLYQTMSTDPDFFHSNVHFWQVDERYVPQDHKDSNFKMIMETLFAKNKAHNFHYFDTTQAIPEALGQYMSKMPEKFDITLLGLGPDGHTASLFPGTKALDETHDKVAYTKTQEFAVEKRLTLTFPPIMSSRKLLILLKGKEKNAILEKIQAPDADYHELPAAKLLKHPDLTINHLQ